MSSLVAFHRVLIAAGIAFCFGFAIWEIRTWRATGATGTLVLAITFIVLGIGLLLYLRRLRRILGYDRD
jgi:ABC-type spermidine/putrescine transport system permease subunit II